jgi:hypothetical protein
MSVIWLPALVSAGLLAGGAGGCASANATAPEGIAAVTQPDPAPAPRTLNPSHDGGVYTMKVGQTAGLIVPDPQAPDPEIEGQSVQVVALNNIDASGRREWELRAKAPGRTTIRAKGSKPFTVTLDVRQ